MTILISESCLRWIAAGIIVVACSYAAALLVLMAKLDEIRRNTRGPDQH